MILSQVFKTAEGASKRCRFEDAHCNDQWFYHVVRFLDGGRDVLPFSAENFPRYTYRMEKTKRRSNG